MPLAVGTTSSARRRRLYFRQTVLGRVSCRVRSGEAPRSEAPLAVPTKRRCGLCPCLRSAWVRRRSRLLTRQRRDRTAVFAERVLEGVDDSGVVERVVIWIERKPGALWAVGRAVNPQHRPSELPRPDDYVFEGYELEDALEQANSCLTDDARVSAEIGRPAACEPFAREELLKPLERWFFGR